MSVIRVQAFQFSIVNYVATALGAISTLWIYPLDFDAYGLAQFLVSMATLFIPIATLGTLTLVIKFFPEFSSEGLRKSYLFNILMLGFGFLTVSALIAVVINEPILKLLDLLQFDGALIAEHKYTLAILIAIMFYNSVLIAHSSNYNKITVPSIFQTLVPKLVLPVLILAIYLEVISLPGFARLWVLSFGLISIGLTIYLSRIDALNIRPEFHLFSRQRLRRLLSYSGYMGAGTLGSIMIGKIDVIMIATLIGLKETGVYGLAIFIGNVLAIPTSAVWQITSPQLAKGINENDWDRITEIYKKTSANLLIIGVFIYFLLLGLLDSALHLSPKYEEMTDIIPFFAVIGISKLIDMGASVNHQILTYSTRYRSVLTFVAILGISNVVLNYFLVTGMDGAIGAAISTCITVYLYHILKYRYIEQKFGIHPFSPVSIKIAVTFVLLLIFYLVLPQVGSPVVYALLYTAGLCIIYYACIRLLRIESDITILVFQYAEKILRRLGIRRG